MTTPTTAAPITLPLGTSTDGQDVSWTLADTEGRPCHAIIVGPTGSGGTTALARLCAVSRTVDADVHPVLVDLDHGPDYYAPVWERTLPASRCTTDTDLRDELDAVEDTADVEDGHNLLLVDGDRALRCAPQAWVRLLGQADRLRMSVVVRVHGLTLDTFGGCDVLRSRLATDGQYLALGRPVGTSAALASDLLPGYTVPDGRQAPGRGVYGYRGDTDSVTVTHVR
ncbi:hypothetical protein [Nocardiopsis sp. FIRDI 009]|uniref:hypothetical protein n=1 Tax=Nocardiopsis sp. FIRDI 009 TaxID=714197 RepID=UPI000E23C86F|nr:hypothetical protein [Nocardiopsis sp. FIRDI 009]